MEKRLTLNKRNSRVIKNKKDAWKFDTALSKLYFKNRIYLKKKRKFVDYLANP